jgi:hypothetical protein
MAARRTVSRGSRHSATSAWALPGVAQQPQRLDRADLHHHVRRRQRLQQQGHHLRRRHARQGTDGALLDELALVAEQLEEQHGRVLVAQPPDGRGRLGAHLDRRVVDERRHQGDALGRRDPGQAAHGALAHRVVRVAEAVA